MPKQRKQSLDRSFFMVSFSAIPDEKVWVAYVPRRGEHAGQVMERNPLTGSVRPANRKTTVEDMAYGALNQVISDTREAAAEPSWRRGLRRVLSNVTTMVDDNSARHWRAWSKLTDVLGADAGRNPIETANDYLSVPGLVKVLAKTAGRLADTRPPSRVPLEEEYPHEEHSMHPEVTEALIGAAGRLARTHGDDGLSEYLKMAHESADADPISVGRASWEGLRNWFVDHWNSKVDDAPIQKWELEQMKR